jgi:hypothetical protein
MRTVLEMLTVGDTSRKTTAVAGTQHLLATAGNQHYVASITQADGRGNRKLNPEIPQVERRHPLNGSPQAGIGESR